MPRKWSETTPREEVLEPEILNDDRPPADMVAYRMRDELVPIFEMEPVQLEAALARVTQNWNVFLRWIKENLVDGTPRCYPNRPLSYRDSGYDSEQHAVRADADYARIYTKGGWSKHTLLKPGSEKIASKLLRCQVRWPGLAKYEEAAVSGIAIQTVILRCELLSGDRIIGEGGGASNVSEGDVNKALKMAMKSSQIAAVLSVAGISSVFTQDVEDMRNLQPDPPRTVSEPPKKPAPRRDASLASEAVPGPAEPLTPEMEALPWLDMVLGFGKWKNKTWRNFCEGNLESGRIEYLRWLVQQEAKSDSQRQSKVRAQTVIELVEKREEARARAAQDAPPSDEWNRDAPYDGAVRDER